MKIRVIEEKNIAVVTVDGSISQECVPLFRVKLLELLMEGKCKLILDMQHTQYLSSMGLAVLVEVKKRATEVSGDLKLASMNYLVKNLLTMTNLIKKIEAFDSVEEAIAAYESVS